MKKSIKEINSLYGHLWDIQILDENHHSVTSKFLGYMVISIYDFDIIKSVPTVMFKFTFESNDYILKLS